MARKLADNSNISLLQGPNGNAGGCVRRGRVRPMIPEPAPPPRLDRCPEETAHAAAR